MTDSHSYPVTELLPCPFCGSKSVDPAFWATTDCCGPGCDECGATAETGEKWNNRIPSLAQASPPSPSLTSEGQYWRDRFNECWDRSKSDALLLAAKKALNYIENTESELGIRLDCGNNLRSALLASALSSTDPRCTCAAIVNPNIPHARSCPLSSTHGDGK